eukprot:Clim_evm95s25 gene=Clim_evmTU95s25
MSLVGAARSNVPIPSLDIKRLGEAFRNGRIDCRNLVEQCVQRIKEQSSTVGAFTQLRPLAALSADAEASHQRISTGAALGPLDGIPIAIKENFAADSLGLNAGCGSALLNPNTDSNLSAADADMVRALKAAGALVLGSTSMDEFAMGNSGTTNASQPRGLEGLRDQTTVTRNPLDLSRVPGGSSGGSAAAVSSRQCFFALGSDTGGSVRLPASYCGVVGLKPTYGSFSRGGLTAYASSLDCPGILGANVSDVRIGFDTLREGLKQLDYVRDMNCILEDSRHTSASQGTVQTVGIPKEWMESSAIPHHLRETIEDWKKVLSSMPDITVKEVSLSASTQGALAAYYVLALTEASSNLMRFDGLRYGGRLETDPELVKMLRDPSANLRDLAKRVRGALFGPEVQRRILVGTFALMRDTRESYYLQAAKVRRLVSEQMHAVLRSECDVLLSPCALGAAPCIEDVGEIAGRASEVEDYINDLFTVPASLAGLPAVTIPGKFIDVDVDEGCSGPAPLPLGLQLIGPAFGERKLLDFAAAVEVRLDEHLEIDAEPY